MKILKILKILIDDFYNLIKDKLIINRKKEKVLATIEHFKDYRGTSYNNYMRDKLAL